MRGRGDDGAATDAQGEWIVIGRWAAAASADEAALVLHAVGIRSAVTRVEGESPGADDAYELIVPPNDAGFAREQLARFAVENRGWPSRPVLLPPMTMGIGAALVYAASLALAFLVQQQRSYGVDWVLAGRADAALILDGEWWRAVTALSLHADVGHLAGNLLFGALFGVILAQSVGGGAAWLIFVVAGAAGNLANAWVQPPEHLAIGASTGVFALVGAQAACDWMRRGRRRRHPMRRWAPVIMGVALLAWFGGSGGDRRVDIAAHAFGFLFGLICGAAMGWRTVALFRTSRAQNAMTAAALTLVGFAWAMALRF